MFYTGFAAIAVTTVDHGCDGIGGGIGIGCGEREIFLGIAHAHAYADVTAKSRLDGRTIAYGQSRVIFIATEEVIFLKH